MIDSYKSILKEDKLTKSEHKEVGRTLSGNLNSYNSVNASTPGESGVGTSIRKVGRYRSDSTMREDRRVVQDRF